MLADRVVLPGEQVLTRLVGSVRERATQRLWSRLARASSPEVIAALEALLVVPEGKRRSDLDRLRRPPFSPTIAGLVQALERLGEVRSLGVGGLDLSAVPARRVAALARYAEDAWATQLADLAPNTSLISGQWDQICRLAASLEARTVTPSAILRSLQWGPNPSSLGRALVELGRIIKTLHVLDYCHDADYRRAIHRILVRGESRNSLARDTFHGGRGQLRQHYQAGQENQLGALGLMVNVIVLWQTVYIQAALDHLVATGQKFDRADVARLSPLGHPTINLNGRYRITGRAPSGGLRPLRRAR